jgi:hypothetical protein
MKFLNLALSVHPVAGLGRLGSIYYSVTAVSFVCKALRFFHISLAKEEMGNEVIPSGWFSRSHCILHDIGRFNRCIVLS